MVYFSLAKFKARLTINPSAPPAESVGMAISSLVFIDNFAHLSRCNILFRVSFIFKWIIKPLLYQINHPTMITIAIPFFNDDKYLNYAIRSVINQTYESWTLLLVDDGSSDRSVEIAREYEIGRASCRERVRMEMGGGE